MKKVVVVNTTKIFNPFETFLTIGTISFCPDGWWLDCLSLIIAAQLRDAGYEVTYIDGDNQMMAPGVIAEAINKIDPNYVIFNTETIDYFRAPLSSYENINRVVDSIVYHNGCQSRDDVSPQVIVYGTHPCIEIMGLSNKVDYVIKGEGDAVIVKLIDYLEENGREIESPNLDRIWRVKDLDELPFPAYDMVLKVPQECSNFAYSKFTRMKFTQSVLSRGCKIPNLKGKDAPACTFCCRLATGTCFRAMSPGRVEEYFDYLISFGYRSTYIIDDCFAANQDWGKEVCRRLIKRNNDLKFSVQTRIDVILDEELVSLMKNAGCMMIGLGVESYNDDLLEIMGKKVTCEKIDSALDICKRNGIDVTAFLQLGLKGETQDHRDRTERFLVKNLSEGRIFATGPFLSCPYVGSIGWEKSKKDYPYYTVLESMQKAGLCEGVENEYDARKMWISYDLGINEFKDTPSPVTKKKVWSHPASILKQIKKYRPDVFGQWWKYISHIGWSKRLEKYFR